MSTSTITCPECGHTFPLHAAVAHDLEEEKQKAVHEAVARAKQETEDNFGAQIKDLQAKFQREHEKRKEAEENELKLREREEDLKDREQKLDLELKRRLSEETERIQRESREDLEVKHRLEMAELQRKMDQVKEQAEELQRKAEQGSQQIQGEALEIEFEHELRENFKYDEISEVKKGQRGADIIQKVFNKRGQYCGTIIWEMKNTRTWGKDWIEKLKEDKSRSEADVMGLVSVALPDGIKHFDQIEDVWVSCYSTALALACVLRDRLIHIADMRRAMDGQGNKMSEIYLYMISPQFKNHIERIVNAFYALNNDIEKERAAMEKIWKARRKQLQAVISTTTNMYTELSFIVGQEMPQIEALSLEALPVGESAD